MYDSNKKYCTCKILKIPKNAEFLPWSEYISIIWQKSRRNSGLCEQKRMKREMYKTSWDNLTDCNHAS